MALFTIENKFEKCCSEKVKPLCLIIGEDDWKNIEVPDNLEFDLGKNWSHILQ